MDFDELVTTLRRLEGRRAVLRMTEDGRPIRGVLRYVVELSDGDEAVFAVERPRTQRRTKRGTSAVGAPFGFDRRARTDAEWSTRGTLTVALGGEVRLTVAGGR